jgi:hypothetical protein
MNKTFAAVDPIEARVTRALTEVLLTYRFIEHDGALIVEGPSGAYIVDPIAGTCSCPDWQHSEDQCCKHLIATRHLALAQGRDLEAEAEERRRQEWQAQMAAEREEIRRKTAWITDEMLARVFR